MICPSRSAQNSAPIVNLVQVVGISGLAGAFAVTVALTLGMGVGTALIIGWLGGPALACGLIGVLSCVFSPRAEDAPAPGLRLVTCDGAKIDAAPHGLARAPSRNQEILAWEEDRISDFSAFVRAQARGDDAPHPAA